MFKLVFRKGRGTRDQIANIRWIIKKAREFQKNIYFCFIAYAKAFDCVDHNKLWKNWASPSQKLLSTEGQECEKTSHRMEYFQIVYLIRISYYEHTKNSYNSTTKWQTTKITCKRSYRHFSKRNYTNSQQVHERMLNIVTVKWSHLAVSDSLWPHGL